MRNLKKYLKLILLIIFISGCSLLKRDTMEDINIITTFYSLEYVTNYLYGNNAIVNSIYPDDTNIDTYKFTDKQIKDYSKNDLFIYMGISNDADSAVTFLNKNKNIKLIDATFGMNFKNGLEELWLNPSNLLMISQNIKTGLSEYITSTYLIKEIESNYDKLRIELSSLDANIKLSISNAKNKTIFVNDKSLEFLEKYGLNVIVVNENNINYEKNLITLKNSITSKTTENFFVLENGTISEEIQKLVTDKKIKLQTIRNLKNITDSERNNGVDYIKISKNNLEALKNELF